MKGAKPTNTPMETNDLISQCLLAGNAKRWNHQAKGTGVQSKAKENKVSLTCKLFWAEFDGFGEKEPTHSCFLLKLHYLSQHIQVHWFVIYILNLVHASFCAGGGSKWYFPPGVPSQIMLDKSIASIQRLKYREFLTSNDQLWWNIFFKNQQYIMHPEGQLW